MSGKIAATFDRDFFDIQEQRIKRLERELRHERTRGVRLVYAMRLCEWQCLDERVARSIHHALTAYAENSLEREVIPSIDFVTRGELVEALRDEVKNGSFADLADRLERDDD